MLGWWALTAWATDVAVVEDPRRDRWTVTWSVEAPARGVLFTRNRNPVQEPFEVKKLVAGELRGHRVILAPAGRLSDSFEATFPTDTSWQEKDYELNVRFGDGGRLLYTDHLFVVPLRCPDRGAACADDALVADEPEVHRFTFTTTPDRFVLTPNGRTAGTGTWDQRRGGVYVYFGAGEPLPDDRIRFVLDPTLPPWVLARTREWIGPLLDHYTAQTGRALSFQPVVLLSYQKGQEGQRDYGGGGLPGQMQLHLEGREWAAETDDNREAYARFLAHETFHMWNGEELSTDLDASEEWLSEGSADLYALWALQALGLLDEAAVRARIRDAASACASELGSAPLLTAHRRGRYRAFYACGSTGLFLLDAALRARSEAASLTTVLQAVFREGDRYSTYDLLEASHRQAGDPLVVAELEQLLRRGLGNAPADVLAAALTSAGVPTAVADAWTAEGVGERALHDALVRTVGACDCGGSVSVWDRGPMLEFDPIPQCDRLRDGMRVTAVAGGPVLPKREALARAWAEIDGQGTLTLGARDGATRELACEGVPRPRVLTPTPR